MIINITPIVNTCFTFIVFFIGLDFAWCGYVFMKTNDIKRVPKLLGYLVLKLFERGNRLSKSTNEIAKTMFSMKAAGIYSLLSGLQLMVSSMVELLSQINFKNL